MNTIFIPLARSVSALLLLFWVLSAQAALNDPCGCNAGLAPELVKYSSSSQVKLAFIQQIDEKQYEKIKRDGSAGADIIDFVSGTANYSDFSEKRRSYISSTNFSLNAEQSESLLFSTVRTTDWGACKRQCIKSQQGFVCDVAEFTEKNIAVSCSWRPEGAAKKRQVNVHADGKTLSPQSIDPNTTRDWHFSRDPSRDLLMTFTPEGGSSQTLKIAATPMSVPTTVRPVKLGSCIGRGGLNGVHFWGPEGADCNGIAPWGKYLADSSVPAPTEVCSCTGHGGPKGVRLWGPKGSACGGIPDWGTYKDQCVSASSLTVCGCVGHGNILEGHILWGPKDQACGGMASTQWGKYTQYCVGPK
ncbi:hypothetical protein ACLBKS_02780 [Hylemonella sp. W303a]|uniref:hypothetical protein n=1 Tax=Hylemonella sp. W303a TaxID=3389873 RepID=UPI00396B2488